MIQFLPVALKFLKSPLFRVLLIIAVVGGSFKAGMSVADGRYAKQMNEQLEEALDLQSKKHEQDKIIQAEFYKGKIQDLENREPIVREVFKYRENPVSSTECFDPDGLRVYNQILTGKAEEPGPDTGT